MEEYFGDKIQSVSSTVNELPNLIYEKKKNLQEFVGKNVNYVESNLSQKLIILKYLVNHMKKYPQQRFNYYFDTLNSNNINKNKNSNHNLKNIHIISAGWDFTCKVNLDNKLTCFGLSYYNQTDAQPPFTNGTYPISKLVTGLMHSCILYSLTKFNIKILGRIHCWGGHNEHKELSTPMAASFLNDSIAVGDEFTCALSHRYLFKYVQCWGSNEYGVVDGAQRKLGGAGRRYDMVAAGAAHVCIAVTRGGKLRKGYGMGMGNDDGVNVSGTNYVDGIDDDYARYENESSVNGNNVECWGSDSQGQTMVPDKVRQHTLNLSTGTAHTCVALTFTYKSVYNYNTNIVCWGMVYGYGYMQERDSYISLKNKINNLHNHDNLNQYDDNEYNEDDDDLNSPSLANLNLANYISAGYEHDCAIMANGTSHCWGENDYGQVDINNHIYSH
eukprot:Mrub_03317.p1 GENE.Mrub_03317~~Mrub_03317.p1  ORF type:complete len:487 (+),score=103.16 Mrub_03317:135-1463(+)